MGVQSNTTRLWRNSTLRYISMTTKKKKLRATWSKKEQDIMFHFPTRKCDGAILAHVFSGIKLHEGRTLIDELKARDYDITTLKFSVELKETN